MTQTKKALMMSIFSMVLCMAMLMGTTFAWFTDTASTAVNIVKSGDLELEIVKDDGTTKIGSESELQWDSDDVKWQPEAEYKTKGFKIKNTGKLALKYKLMVNLEGVSKELRDSIDFYILNKDNNKIGKITEGNLIADSETSSAVETQDAEAKAESISDVYYIGGKMHSDAKDACQGQTLDGIKITVIATQDDIENDSNGNSYDSEAAYPAGTPEVFETALESGGVIQLTKDIEIKPEVSDSQKNNNNLVPQMTVNEDTTLDLSQYKLSVVESAKDKDYGKASPVLIAVTGGTLTINGDGEINCEAGGNQVYGINIKNNAHVVINGGNFYGAITAVQVQQGTLEINGGFFDMAPTCKTKVPEYAKYVVNAIDANYVNGKTIVIKGGTFVNFDPSNNPEGAGTSYVADGYKVVSEEHGTDIWYTVVEDK